MIKSKSWIFGFRSHHEVLFLLCTPVVTFFTPCGERVDYASDDRSELGEVSFLLNMHDTLATIIPSNGIGFGPQRRL